ncbi:MAG TPA: zinc-ribbon and DUF3426 domain-containing protein [Burkholderiaceae bacterium]|jgi:predicted Zn finger-like uncharacterized protein|nr:zinc-ribbon and DUF3426 domain-containing protein [Burkholderiaceae bacterium]
MSLATRCTACGTVFRVVRDQLRVSEGWVRCGRCQEVFNALDSLFDLEREAPPPWPGPAATAAGPAPAASATADEASGAIDLERDPLLHHESTQPLSTAGGDSGAPSESATEHSTGFADARFPSSFMASELAPGGGSDTTVVPDEDSAAPAEMAPEFVRRVDAKQRQQSRGARVAWSLAAVLLLLGFATQATYHLRDWIAALWPQAQAPLEAMCAQAGCRIEPLRRIDSVAVESSGLTRVSGLDAYKLSVVLRNRSGIPVALPSVELALTDPQGQLVARRVLSPAELGTTQRVLQPGAEAPLQVALASSDKRVLGYTVEIFYP